MKRPVKIFSTFLLAILLTSAYLPPVFANAQLPVSGQAGASQVSDDSTGVSFNVSVPWEQLSLEPVTADGREYVHVSLPGWPETAQAGAPILPVYTEMIGVPFGAGVTVNVVPGKVHIQTLQAPVLPMTTQSARMGTAARKTVPYLCCLSRSLW